MRYTLVDFFTDPVLRAPTLGCIFMCVAASLVGVIVFIRRKALVGEALSHATYPGLVLGATLLSVFYSFNEGGFFSTLMGGAFASALLALLFLENLQKRLRVKNDAALCFVLSSFFGVGVLVASHLQSANPIWYRYVQVFLYGQAATMVDIHVWIYLGLTLLIIAFIVLFYRSIQLLYFDGLWAQAIGLSSSLVDKVFVFLLVLAVTVAMKSVGVVLLSGMLIAPALAARQVSKSLARMFWVAGIFGAVSGFLGNYFSVKLSEWLEGSRLVFPTGPMIVLTGSFFAIAFLLLFSKKRRVRE